MRYFKLSVLTPVFLSLFLFACSEKQEAANAPASSQKETAIEHAKKHLDPTYVCPMHPQIVRDEPGSCPICGMDLVLREPVEAKQSETAVEHAQKHLDPKYTCPMHPQIVRDEPGSCPICGMDLVPMEPEQTSGLEGESVEVKISPTVEHNLGVRTAKVARDKLWRRIDTVGYVDYDENHISHIHLRTNGWIEKLYVRSEGERVARGQLLFEVYSPELVNAQEEYLQALNSGNKRLISASQDRLLALGIPTQQIEAINKSKKVSQYVRIYAQHDGILAKLSVRDGMYVTPQLEVMSLAELSSVWLLAEIFESQADWVKVGQPADVRLSYVPGRVWEGEVEYVYPSLNPKTRTLKARLHFDNPDEALKPNMFADVTIYGGARRDVIVIPREALIRTGTEERVILALGEGRYQPRKVVAGIESGDWVEILSGLEVGEAVVTSGQFLIDSEASIKASLRRMTSASGEPQPVMQKKIMGSGVLKVVLPDEHKVNMTHDPIPELGWPDMTMDFKVKPEVDLSAFKAEEKVEFELEEGSDGYVIKAMTRAD
jgi:Cu(I)/Ag(I) efflux system membrane fusion protein